MALDDGTCRPAGVAACAEGFQADGAHGCVAVLPDAACPPGQLAVPGESTCHAVAPCPAGPWPDVPAANEVVYVDASAPVAGADGSKAHPWPTLAAALDAASPGAVVVLAAGSYEGDLDVAKAVRVYGLCPEQTEIVGDGSTYWAVFVSAIGSELHDLAVTGPAVAVGVTGATDVVLDRVWIHDTGDWGIDIEDAQGPTAVSVSRSLVEASHALGIFVAGAAATLDVSASLVRDVVRPPQQDVSAAIMCQEGAKTSVRGSVVERVGFAGIWTVSGNLDLEGVVVRDGLTDQLAVGVAVSDTIDVGNPAHLTMRGSVVERVTGAGIDITSSSASIDDTVIRDVVWSPESSDASPGFGISATQRSSRPSLEAHGLVIERARTVGLLLQATDGFVAGSIVRDTAPEPVGQTHGRGVQINRNSKTLERAVVTLDGCRIERSHELGLLASGSDLTLLRVAVADTAPQVSDGGYGIGVQVQRDKTTELPMTLQMTRCSVANSVSSGVLLSRATGSIVDTLVSDTIATAAGELGDGIAVVSRSQDAVELSGVRVERSARAGVSSFGAAVRLGAVVLECNAIDLDGETNFGAEALFDDGGGNACGCDGQSRPCKALSASLAPPTAPEPD